MRFFVAVLILCACGAAAGVASGVAPGRDGPIVFEAGDEEGGASDLWVLPATGGEPRNVTRSADVDERQPAWSPDMRRIAYVREDELGRGTVVVARADGTDGRRLVVGGIEQRSPAWSPDGRFIAVSICSRVFEQGGPCVSAQIVVVGANGKNRRYLTRPSRRTNAVDQRPEWSPNGKRLAFTRTVDDGENVLFTIAANGYGLRRLVNDRSVVDKSPSWSPDGKRIAYVSDAGSQEDALWLVNATGAGRKLLLESGISDPEDPESRTGLVDPAFAPSGRRIVFSAGGELWTVAVTGGAPTQLTEEVGDEPDWGRAR